MSDYTALIEANDMSENVWVDCAFSVFCSRVYSRFFTHTAAYSHILSFFLSVRYTHSLSLSFSVTHWVVSVVVGNGLNSPHSGDKEGPADRQSTMPPSVPIRKEKKDVPVRTLGSTAEAQGPPDIFEEVPVCWIFHKICFHWIHS